MVGQFHVDFAGGTIQELRARLGGVRILTISMQRDDGATLRAEDRDRADVIVYTGHESEEAKPQEQPASRSAGG